MINPLPVLDGAEVLYYVFLDGKRKTDRCRHFINGKMLTSAFSLAICQYENDSEVYVFHCDENWKVMTDDFLGSVEDAFEQTKIQYEELNKSDWIEFI